MKYAAVTQLELRGAKSMLDSARNYVVQTAALRYTDALRYKIYEDAHAILMQAQLEVMRQSETL